jgi:ankyrin repeat protein
MQVSLKLWHISMYIYFPATDDILILNVSWKNRDHPAATEKTSTADKQSHLLVKRLIDQGSEKLFNKIMVKLRKKNLPQSLVKDLYTRFQLRLLGITKRLEMLLEVDRDDVERILRLEPEIQDVLAQAVVPTSCKEKVTWSQFSRQPVQCTDDRVNQTGTVDHANETSLAVTSPLALDMDRLAEQGYTSLHIACMTGNIQAVKALVGQGANVEDKTSDGLSPFLLACTQNNTELMTFLSSSKADMSVTDNSKKTALHLACNTGHAAVVQWLLDKGFNVNDVDGETRTPLHLACSKGNLQISQLLLKKGANVKAVDCNESIPLHDACESGNVDLVLCLTEKGSKVNARDSYGVTPFHNACMKGNLSLMTVLAYAGADISCPNDYIGKTPIQMALATGKEGIEEWFQNQKKPTTREDLTQAMLLACARGDLEATKALLVKGADVNGVCMERTALISACTTNNVALIKLLLAKKADVNKVPYDDSYSPLGTACMYGYLDVLPVLLQAGANINQKNYYGQTALHLAIEHYRAEVVYWLLSQHGIDVKAKDGDGHTALHMATRQNNMKMVLKLIQAGADVNEADYGGNTAIDLATQ